MPQINRVRVNNVKYNFGTQFYDDFMMRFNCRNTIYDLANGGGKSLLMLLLMQNMIPNCKPADRKAVQERQWQHMHTFACRVEAGFTLPEGWLQIYDDRLLCKKGKECRRKRRCTRQRSLHGNRHRYRKHDSQEQYSFR